MAVYPNWRAGKKVTSSALSQQQTHTVRAASDQTINNSAVQTNDTELFFSLTTSAQYIVELFVSFDAASSTNDINTSWTVPAGTTVGRFAFGATATAASFTSNEITRATVRANTATAATTYQHGTLDQSVVEVLSIITTGTAGNVQFRWSQATAGANNSVRKAGSYMRVTRVG